MKKTIAALAAATVLLGTTACEVPDEKGNAADRADVNKKNGGKPVAKKDAKPNETAGQANAREKAADYLDYESFSRTGLIKQLKYEGFSQKDAEYGADAQHADWNKQAAAKAEEYLDNGSFSRASLIQQLKFEGFTTAQATYGVNKVGLK